MDGWMDGWLDGWIDLYRDFEYLSCVFKEFVSLFKNSIWSSRSICIERICMRIQNVTS